MQFRSRFIAYSLAGFASTAAFAQASNYTSVVAADGKPVQLTYHATARKNCSSAPPPTIKVLESPRDGLLIIRRGELETSKVAGCGRIKLPVEVVFYQAKQGYAGPDHVRYEIADVNGATSTYDVSIKVEPISPKPSKPGTTPL
jgi:hypothetical protein